MKLSFSWRKARKSFLYTLGFLFLGLSIASAFLLQDYHTNLMKERQDRTQKLVETAYNLIAYYQNKAERGEIPPEKARYYALETIRNIMPEPNGYFWVINTELRGVMHPIKPQWEGADLSGYTSPNGKHLFVDMVKMAEEDGSGFYNYLWTKPYLSETRLYNKISYIKLYKPWHWVIGTGVYIDDINAAFWNAVLVACGLTVAVLMFVMALAMTVSENMKHNEEAP